MHSGSTSLLMTGEQTGGRFALLETIAKNTHELPLHAHTREDELIYVMRGDVTFYRDGRPLEGSQGSCVFFPKGSEHTYRVTSSEAQLLIMLMPAGLEGYYQELDGVSETTHYTERLITVAAKYGVKLTGPGPTAVECSEDGGPGTCGMDASRSGNDAPRHWRSINEYPCPTQIAVKGKDR